MAVACLEEHNTEKHSWQDYVGIGLFVARAEYEPNIGIPFHLEGCVCY